MPEETSIACLEVWGGNELVDTHVRVPGLDVYVYAMPFDHAAAGGDVHFVSSCSSGRIARLMLADVSGHGTEVAETGRTLRSLIHRFMNHIDQRKLLMSMNDAFVRLAESGRFATAVVMTYYAPTASLTLCNAGHPPPLVRMSDGQWRYLDDAATEALPGLTNIPLGILDDVGYDQIEVPLDRGDLLLCYSDSLVEARLPDGEELGAKRLLELVSRVDVGYPGRIVPGLIAEFAAIGATTNDDVTILLARSEGTSRGAGFFAQVAGQARLIGQAITRGRHAPWPELTLRNFSGAMRALTSWRR